MASLNAKTRDMSKKAKALRREGLITASMCGKDLPESLSLVIDANEATQFMKNHHVGSEATLVVDGKEYDTMIKSADKDHLNTHYLDMTFQHLIATEKVKGVAEIILLNEDRTAGFLTRDISTVEYKALSTRSRSMYQSFLSEQRSQSEILISQRTQTSMLQHRLILQFFISQSISIWMQQQKPYLRQMKRLLQRRKQRLLNNLHHFIAACDRKEYFFPVFFCSGKNAAHGNALFSTITDSYSLSFIENC